MNKKVYRVGIITGWRQCPRHLISSRIICGEFGELHHAGLSYEIPASTVVNLGTCAARENNASCTGRTALTLLNCVCHRQLVLAARTGEVNFRHEGISGSHHNVLDGSGTIPIGLGTALHRH